MKIEIKNAKRLRKMIETRVSEAMYEAMEKSMGALGTAEIWNTETVANTTWVGEDGSPEPIYLECEYCGQINLLTPERSHKGCGACGGMLSLDLIVEEDDQVEEWRNPAAGVMRPRITIERESVRGTAFADVARAARELQVAFGSSFLPSVKAATEACNKLGRAAAGSQAHA